MKEMWAMASPEVAAEPPGIATTSISGNIALPLSYTAGCPDVAGVEPATNVVPRAFVAKADADFLPAYGASGAKRR